MFRGSVCTLVCVLLWQLGAASPVPPAVFAQERAGRGPFSRHTLRPFWLSATMYGESVLFLRDDPAIRPRASLLIQPTRILSVCSSSGEVTYQEGRDYLWKPGTKEIVLPPRSAISFQRPQDLRRPAIQRTAKEVAQKLH